MAPADPSEELQKQHHSHYNFRFGLHLAKRSMQSMWLKTRDSSYPSLLQIIIKLSGVKMRQNGNLIDGSSLLKVIFYACHET